MLIVVQIIFYLILCVSYRNNQLNQIFTLKTLQTLKIAKYRTKIFQNLTRREKRIKWFLFWPLIDIYECYENWQENRNRNTKS